MSYSGVWGHVEVNLYRKRMVVCVLINNGDVTRRFLSLRVGPICTTAVAYELMNHRHRRTVFFLD